MKVVSNASPLRYLVCIKQADVFWALFGEVMIPEAVRAELTDEGTPEIVRQWIHHAPAWLKVMPVSAASDPMLSRLHRGEQDAILLGEHLSADLLLLDEKMARRIAVERGFKVTGVIGILDRAATAGLVDLPAVITQLRRTNFRIAPRVLKSLLERHSSSSK